MFICLAGLVEVVSPAPTEMVTVQFADTLTMNVPRRGGQRPHEGGVPCQSRLKS
jgi:hypothetical protein